MLSRHELFYGLILFKQPAMMPNFLQQNTTVDVGVTYCYF